MNESNNNSNNNNNNNVLAEYSAAVDIVAPRRPAVLVARRFRDKLRTAHMQVSSIQFSSVKSFVHMKITSTRLSLSLSYCIGIAFLTISSIFFISLFF